MLPDYEPTTGYLPPGRHSASWSEVVERFATNAHRTGLLGFLENALQLLRQAGCRQVWLNGSFTTDAAQPHDVDVAWDAYGVRPKDLHPLFRSNTAEIRAERRKTFGGDYVAVYEDNASLTRFYETDRSGEPKGIVAINLNTLPKGSA